MQTVRFPGLPSTVNPSRGVQLTLTSSRDVGALMQKMAKCQGKAKKATLRADSRGYPAFKPGMSTARYVELYATGNGWSGAGAFFAPLNAEPCTLYSGEDLHEIIDDAEIAQDAPQAPETCADVPMVPPAPVAAPALDPVPVLADPAPILTDKPAGCWPVARVPEVGARAQRPGETATDYLRRMHEGEPLVPARPVAARCAFKSLRLGDAFQLDPDGPVWVRVRGGFRPGCGGQLHACANHVQVIRYTACDLTPAPVEKSTLPATVEKPSEPAATDDLPKISSARYSRGMLAVRCAQRSDGFVNRQQRLAEAVGGRYSHRERAYIMTKGAASRMSCALQEGRDATMAFTGHRRYVLEPLAVAAAPEVVLSEAVEHQGALPSTYRTGSHADCMAIADVKDRLLRPRPSVPIHTAHYRPAGPALRLAPIDPRLRIPARFAPLYLLAA